MTDPALDHSLDRDARQDIADVLVRYATGIDRRDWALFRTCFTDDCDADYGAIGVWHGVDAIADWMEATHEPCGHTMHRITNIVVTPTAEGASTRSYVEALIMDGENCIGVRPTGFYDDDLVDTPDGWKIARRRFTTVMLRMGLEGVDLGGQPGTQP